MSFTVLELCAGGGGQALGLELAGFESVGAVELEPLACETLRLNRPDWSVIQQDIRSFSGKSFRGVDLLAAGVPCPPFSIAGKQLGESDERDLFPEALRLIEEVKPRAVMLENVPGFASTKFNEYRRRLGKRLHYLGYEAEFRVLQAAQYGVPQLRPRFILVAMRKSDFQFFRWPEPSGCTVTVSEALIDLMASNGWGGAERWFEKARQIAPTIVGGSKKHGGPDLGPTRARVQWNELGVDGKGIADLPPTRDTDVDHKPRLTLRMVARLQSFPDDWTFAGKKTPAYRQIGNALPPLVAKAVGISISQALNHEYPAEGGGIRLLESHPKNKEEYGF
ncbi:MAG: DNA cytosine methyltransferase, partial [Verrucomicrobiota bacterium]